MNNHITGLAPILPEEPRLLILGSMPGVQSLEGEKYYMNPRNHFWPILFNIFNTRILQDYDEKISWVMSKQIALWDTIHSCIRKGSLDASIKELVPNNIEKLLQKNPTIECILCNGTKAYDTFNRYICMTDYKHIHVYKMPSTSPIPGRYTKSFAGKVEAWAIIADYIDINSN